MVSRDIPAPVDIGPKPTDTELVASLRQLVMVTDENREQWEEAGWEIGADMSPLYDGVRPGI